MSLPPGFLEELRTRTSLAKVAGSKVVWDARKSNPGRGDLWAPCPFHQEKTASFHVDDKKGFYYCFGCHAKGDAVTFLRETGNMSFIEAVETLARDAGMPMPARDPAEAARADRRSELADVMELAVKHYRLQLRASAGAAARDYLEKRRLTDAAIERFDIGFAPDARQGLFKALTQRGVTPEQLVEAGLCARPDDQGREQTPYDRFRDRIIFPIRDARGRCIGLGGRAMDPNAPAKYLNSPETPLFDKGRSLYHHGPAREAAGKGQTLIVAEGYMDVIALAMAGFTAAVAPLGTAITEDQLRMIWRIHPEPIIALDGDKAGIAAALRLIDLALPLLQAGQALRFALLPEGQDPDDLIRSGGPEAMRRVLDAAQPMVTLLWQRETEGRVFDSPERRATLDKSLRAALARIADPSVRDHYTAEIKNRRHELFGRKRTPGPGLGPQLPFQRGKGNRRGAYPDEPATPLPGTKASLLATGVGPVEETLAEAMILAICAIHPALVAEFESPLELLDFTAPGHVALRGLMLRHAHQPEIVNAALAAELPGALEKIMGLAHVAIAPPVRNTKDTALARHCLAEELAKLEARRSARAEIAEAGRDLAGLADEGVTWRLSRAAEALRRPGEPLAESDDLGEDRAALSGHIQGLIDSAAWTKKKS